MKPNTNQQIINLINDAMVPVILMVVSEECDKGKPPIQDQVEKLILSADIPVSFYAGCFPEQELSFPIPAFPMLYFYLPKNHVPAFRRIAPQFQTIKNDIEIIYRMMGGMTLEEARYSKEEQKLIRDTEAAFEAEEKKDFPPKFVQMRSFAKEIFKSAKRGLTGLPVIASAEVSKERYDICLGCDRFDVESSRCRECGCGMQIKTQLVGSTCPLKKW